MRFRPIHAAFFIATAAYAAPALAQDDYPLPDLAEDPYAVGASYAYEGAQAIEDAYQAPAPYAPAPYAPAAWPLGYSDAERASWLAECRARIGGDAYGADACGDYLARYETGNVGGFDYGQTYRTHAAARHETHGYSGGSCGGGCGCGCTVSYRFAPIAALPTPLPRPNPIRRVIETEEWVDEEPPVTAARVIPDPRPVKTVPVKAAPTKTVPVKTVPVKSGAPRSVK